MCIFQSIAVTFGKANLSVRTHDSIRQSRVPYYLTDEVAYPVSNPEAIRQIAREFAELEVQAQEGARLTSVDDINRDAYCTIISDQAHFESMGQRLTDDMEVYTRIFVAAYREAYQAACGLDNVA